MYLQTSALIQSQSGYSFCAFIYQWPSFTFHKSGIVNIIGNNEKQQSCEIFVEMHFYYDTKGAGHRNI